jgi:glycosyltransferase involved in cell wall biosynthesis
MRVGIMLRAFEEKGGVGVYTRNVTRQLIDIAPEHDYFLYMTSDRHRDDFAADRNVTVRAVKAPGKALWDQVAMPYWFRRDRLDVIFHPKFTVPLLCPGRGVMVLHGAGWFIPETQHFWSRTTRIYTRIMMPIYCRLAGAVVSVSNITRDVFIKSLGVSPEKITAIYFGPGPQFKTRYDAEQIARIREKYALPDRFILTISGGDRDDRKNFGVILEAFRRIHAQQRCKLVVAGRDCEKFRERYDIPADGYGKDIVFPGWVDQMDLPAFYQSATIFLYPSNMEAHPIPITEALASGTPIVTSNVFGLKELAGDAAVLVDPSDPGEIADAVIGLIDDTQQQTELKSKALERSRMFDWGRCARETLDVLERVGQG